MTFSKNVRDHFPVIRVAWGAPWEAPRALLGPLGPHRAHGGRPRPHGALGALWAHVGPLGPYWAHVAAAAVPKAFTLVYALLLRMHFLAAILKSRA